MPSLGDLVEIDVKYVPDQINNRKYYQFTAIDCHSRWRYLKVYDDISSYSAIEFLKEVIQVAHFKIKAIKTDNGVCFTNRYVGYAKSKDPLNPKLHILDIFCQKHNIIHYLIDPGKPAQNGKVERSHRTDQEHFYNVNHFKNVSELEKKIRIWNDEYNNLEHISLKGKTPNEMVLESLNKFNSKPPYVCS
jgi:transposase InsO family protein